MGGSRKFIARARQVLNRDIAYDSGSFDQLYKAVRIPRQGAPHSLRQGNRDKCVERRKSDASCRLYFGFEPVSASYGWFYRARFFCR